MLHALKHTAITKTLLKVWVVLAAMVVTWLAVASAIVNMIWGRRAR